MSGTVRARCGNFGNCPLADGGETLEVASLGAYPCQNRIDGHGCGIVEAGATTTPAGSGRGRTAILGALAVVALAVVGAGAAWLMRAPAPSCQARDIVKVASASTLLERSDACLSRARQESSPAKALAAANGAVAALERAATMAGPQQDRALQALGDVFSPVGRLPRGAFAGHAGLPPADAARARRAYASCADTSPACAAGLAALSPATATAAAPAGRLFDIVASNGLSDQLLPSLAAAYLSGLGASDLRVALESGGWRVEGDLGGSAASVRVRTSGASGVFRSLGGDGAQVGASSRRQDDADVAAGQGDLRRPGATEFIIGLDAVHVGVHPANPLGALSVAQTERIFAGEISDWSALGGAPGPIRVHRPRDQSGEVEDFSKLVMRGRPFAASARAHESSAEVAAAVAADPAAIGFLSGSAAGQGKVLAISSGGPAFPPDAYHVRRQEYPLTRFVYLYLRGGAGDGHARRFVQFALSDAGQAVVVKDDHVPVTLHRIASPNPALVRAHAQRIGRCVTLDRAMRPAAHVAHFEFGSESLDGLSVQALESAVVPELRRRAVAPDGVQLLGYTDDVGDPDRERVRSHQRARTVAAVLRRAGFNPVVTGCGMDNPIADNTQPAGRARNRRVDIYYAPGGRS